MVTSTGPLTRREARALTQRPRRTGRRGPMIAAYVILSLGALLMVFPFVWMLLSSFKDAREVLSPGIWPSRFTLVNYVEVITRTSFPRWFLNSLIVATATTASVLLLCSLVGYVLARLRFPGKNLIFILILSTLMIPTEMLVIPWYVISSRFDWINTYWGLIFPGLIPGFGVFLMRQFFQTVPRDLFDAGRIDGVSEPGLFFRIGLPLVGPGLAALGIFSFIGNWNAYLWPLIAGQSPSMRTVPVGISLFSGEAGAAWHLIMAASSLAIVPVLIVFVLLQRQIIEGVVLSGIKG
ncbi:MAG TPA: carbohydrate ABC transporter permease [Trueperaceae bacterium]|nr:carbohydrate ABC transporter permease [Trueperaceae bacterium]